MKLLLTAEPLREAVAKLGAKSPVASVLRTREWEDMPLGLREGAFLSAGVEDARQLSEMQKKLLQALELSRDQETGRYMTKDRFIAEARQIAIEQGLGSEGAGRHTDLRDITSAARLGLIYDMQVGAAQGMARLKSDLTAGALDASPAYEFVRLYPRRVPRTEWPQRFRDAAIEAGDERALDVLARTGRMVALKTSDTWRNLSRFGTPWEPFDFGSGKGLVSLTREEAEALKLIEPDEWIEPSTVMERFQDNLKASVRDITPEAREALQDVFGPQIDVEDDTVSWNSDAMDEYRDVGEWTEAAQTLRDLILAIFGKRAPA